jgi:transcriptional regulator of acetoin/glycerol metabolism
MVIYTLCEKDKMDILHASDMSQSVTADKYHQHHPGQPRSSHHLIGDLTCFKENGSMQDKPCTGCPRSTTGLANSVAVTAKVTASPQRSIRKIAQESAIDRSSVHRILQQHKFHPYKTHIVQELHSDNRQTSGIL